LGTRERREREREEVREKILDAARELFVHEGYEAVTMRKIAQRIEYSPTAIYLHFKDKQQILRELCDRDFAELARQFSAIARIADPIERLQSTGRAYIEFAIAYPNHYRLMFMTPRPPFGEEAESAIEKGNPEQDAYAFLKAILAECAAAGRLRPELADLDLLTQTVWAAAHGVASLHIAKESDDWVDFRPIPERARQVLDVLLHGITRAESRDDRPPAGPQIRRAGKRAES
jgi:AcrR family transcriptional regulator